MIPPAPSGFAHVPAGEAGCSVLAATACVSRDAVVAPYKAVVRHEGGAAPHSLRKRCWLPF